MQLIFSWRHCMSHTASDLASTATVQVHWFASDLFHPAPPVLLCLIQLILDRGFPALPVLLNQPGASACHLDPCCALGPCHLDSIAALPLRHITMSLDPKTGSSLSPIVMAPWSTVIPVTDNPLKYHLPAHCQLFLISFAVYSVIHCALTWDPHGSRHHAPSDSYTLYVHKKP